MLRLTELKLPLDHAENEIEAAILKRLKLRPHDLIRYAVFRRAADARKRSAIMLTYTLDIEVRNEAALLRRLAGDRNLSIAPDMDYRFVTHAPDGAVARPIVIGAGPCGLFAALVLAQMGFRPIILERGKVIRERTKDTWGFWRRSVLNPESNVQFGEGGAGTFSDGKLYSQIKDPHHHGRKVLTEFVKAGAPPEILYVAKPHIGTFRLVTIVENIRQTIEALGGEYRFESKVTDLVIDVRPDGSRQVRGVVLSDGDANCGRSRRAGGRAQRARHLPDALRSRRRHGGEAVLDRRPHRASAVADRSLPLRRRRRASTARCGRLQAGASRQQRPFGLQLLHVSRRHRGGGGLRARPRW